MAIATTFSVFIAILLSFANGANDVSRGISTLIGSGVDHRRALLWGSLWTGVGAVLSFFFATAMLETFTSGWIASEIRIDAMFGVAVGLGASVWVLLASRVGLPVSTTHSISGAIIGVGWFAFGAGNIQWMQLLNKIGLPLLFSPFIALALTFLLYRPLYFLLRPERQVALCIGITQPVAQHLAVPKNVLQAAGLQVSEVSASNQMEVCVYRPTFLRINCDRIHWLSSALISAARALNDMPKIAAIAAFAYLTVRDQMNWWLIGLLLAVSMTVGSYVGGRRVSEVMGNDVTNLKRECDGPIANLITGILVTVAAKMGLPVSTTHVSSGAIAAVGLRRGAKAVDWVTLRNFIMAWIATLPITGVLAVVVYVLLGYIF